MGPTPSLLVVKTMSLLPSFNQLGSTLNSGFANRITLQYSCKTSVPANYAFGQSNFFSAPNPASATLGTSNPTFKFPGSFGSLQPIQPMGSGVAFKSPGSFGSQQPIQPFGSGLTSNVENLNMTPSNAGSSPFSTSPIATSGFPSSTNNQLASVFKASDTNVVGQASLAAQSLRDDNEYEKTQAFG